VEWMHPEIERVDIEVDAELAEQYEAALRAHKAAEAAKVEATSRMIVAMGKARRAMRGKQSLASRVPGRNGAPPYLRANPTILATQAAPVTKAKGKAKAAPVAVDVDATTAASAVEAAQGAVGILQGIAAGPEVVEVTQGAEVSAFAAAVAEEVAAVATVAGVPAELLRDAEWKDPAPVTIAATQEAIDTLAADAELSLGVRLQRDAERRALARQREAAAAREGQPAFHTADGMLAAPVPKGDPVAQPQPEPVAVPEPDPVVPDTTQPEPPSVDVMLAERRAATVEAPLTLVERLGECVTRADVIALTKTLHEPSEDERALVNARWMELPATS